MSNLPTKPVGGVCQAGLVTNLDSKFGLPGKCAYDGQPISVYRQSVLYVVQMGETDEQKHRYCNPECFLAANPQETRVYEYLKGQWRPVVREDDPFGED